MSIYAVIDGDTVANVIVVDPDSDYPLDDLVDVTDLQPQPGIGWTYDGRTFTEPDVDTSAPQLVQVTVDPAVLGSLGDQAAAATTVAGVRTALAGLIDHLDPTT